MDVSELRRYMRIGLQEFDGVTGTIAFDERGDVRRYPTMHTIFNGRVVSTAWLKEMKRQQIRRIIAGSQPSAARQRGEPIPLDA